jgi:hypothetical protein
MPPVGRIKAGEAVVANVGSGIYHLSDCSSVSKISDNNFRGMRSWKVAFRLGLTACELCKPHDPLGDHVVGGQSRFHEENCPHLARWPRAPRPTMLVSEALKRGLEPCGKCLWYIQIPRLRFYGDPHWFYTDRVADGFPAAVDEPCAEEMEDAEESVGAT